MSAQINLPLGSSVWMHGKSSTMQTSNLTAGQGTRSFSPRWITRTFGWHHVYRLSAKTGNSWSHVIPCIPIHWIRGSSNSKLSSNTYGCMLMCPQNKAVTYFPCILVPASYISKREKEKKQLTPWSWLRLYLGICKRANIILNHGWSPLPYCSC